MKEIPKYVLLVSEGKLSDSQALRGYVKGCEIKWLKSIARRNSGPKLS